MVHRSSAATLAPAALASAAAPAATGSFRSWPAAEHAAGFGLKRPTHRHGLKRAGDVVVARCEVTGELRKRDVFATYGSRRHRLLGIEQNNSGAPCGAAVSPELAFVLSTDRRPGRPRLSPQESLVLRMYASGATLQASARRARVAYGTAREYLERIKRKYTDAGRPTRTKLDLAERAREDRLDLDGLQPPG